MDNPLPTLIKNPIYNPAEPRHFMQIRQLPYAVTASAGNLQIACSRQAMLLSEVGRNIYAPVVYFPRDDVLMSHLDKSAKVTECPLKGSTEYFDIRDDNQTLQNAAWSYNIVLDFDKRLMRIQNSIAFDTNVVQIIELTTNTF